jgi:thymidine phosphorylase
MSVNILLPQEVIRTKRDGGKLNQQQVQFFVDGLVDQNFNDAQVGSMAMAIFQQGMSTEEITWLTHAMMNSGEVLHWQGKYSLNGPIVDKHSTGGVGDKVSFMLAAIVAACGAFVPMVSGRGLGHTGGTSDKLESIAGFNVQPSTDKFQQIVKELGFAIISQTDNIAPADKRLYGIRDVTATVESIPLITASILSKKLSAGLDALVMDIKVGNGAMMTDIKQAKALAQSIVNVANHAGVKTQAIITDMNQVLGASAGNALEIIETIDYLTGKYQEPRLHQVVVSLAKAMLINTKLADDDKSAKTMVEKALSSGKAAEVFAKMISALGGDINLLENPWQSMQKAVVIKDVVADSDGFINAMQTRDIGMSIVAMGGGRLFNGQAIDHSVGFDEILPVGAAVKRGDIIARVHASTDDMACKAANQYLEAIELGKQLNEIPMVIYQTIDK